MAEQHKEFFRMMKEIKELLTPHVTSLSKIRIGGRRDGSYVIAVRYPQTRIKNF
mgnify:CR=1 FL=1